MKLLGLVTFLALVLGTARAADRPDLTADQIQHEGAIVHGSGHVRATVGSLTIWADQGTLHSDTGELALNGHVHATLPARADHSLFRYGSGALLTDQPVGLTADRLTIKNNVLTAAGNLVLVPVDPEKPGARLHGEEMSMDLRTADATVRGNIRTVHLDDRTPPSRFTRPSLIFPPDIVKQ